jgi:hypothetical protein
MRLQHGDLILEAIECVPEGFKEIDLCEGFVVEKGEGMHTHVLENVKDCQMFVNEKGELVLKASDNANLNHEEHGVMKLDKKIYRKYIEQEYDAELDEQRNVID